MFKIKRKLESTKIYKDNIHYRFNCIFLIFKWQEEYMIESSTKVWYQVPLFTPHFRTPVADKVVIFLNSYLEEAVDAH